MKNGKINIKMITLTETILFYILVTLIAYYFIPWKRFTKAPFSKLLNFWVQSVVFAVGIVGLTYYIINNVF